MSTPITFTAPSALEYFAALVADDASLSVIEAAAAVAQDEYPQLDIQAVLADIDALGLRLQARIPADAVPLQRLRWLNRFFFGELGFSGNVNDYYDCRNSYLHCVLESRRGIPITLALIYVELATHIGLHASGVSFPGHFLVKVKMPQGEVVIDPFSGQSLSRDELDAMLAPYRGGRGTPGSIDAPLGLLLRSATPREIVVRVLRNLKEIHRGSGDWARFLAVTQRLVIVAPDAWEERRDRGLAQAELGATEAAATDLRAYLDGAPGAADAPAIRARLAELGRRPPPRLH
ncbi:SirB1 family protein [Piscinibacter koreensis]|uniref:Tetratricopeptide repeat protein n=1 Tax=Piscinibacter koreensis TaxID=2742824 RepID=A0A7Y6TXI7_9BURK|nr:transglutaminase-like domain-containing protein [Schlegelella koreensis]NUZ07142.1 tetratricopeptide repeat protein [Schlegelella koreensis]